MSRLAKWLALGLMFLAPLSGQTLIDLTQQAKGCSVDTNILEWDTATGRYICVAKPGSGGTHPVALASDVSGILPAGSGGTGVTSCTDGGIVLGSGSGAVTCLGAAANGQIPIGDGVGDPVLATLTAGAGGQITITNGVGSITVDVGTNSIGTNEIATNGVDSAEIAADAVGTSELDDGADTPAAGEWVQVDPGDTSQFRYRSDAELVSDTGAASKRLLRRHQYS